MLSNSPTTQSNSHRLREVLQKGGDQSDTDHHHQGGGDSIMKIMQDAMASRIRAYQDTSNSPPQSAANYTEPRQPRLLGGVQNSPQKAYMMGSSSQMKKRNNLLRVNGANSSNLSNSHFGGAGASTTAHSVMHTQTDTKAAQYYSRPAKSELGFLSPNGGALGHGSDNNSDQGVDLSTSKQNRLNTSRRRKNGSRSHSKRSFRCMSGEGRADQDSTERAFVYPCQAFKQFFLTLKEGKIDLNDLTRSPALLQMMNAQSMDDKSDGGGSSSHSKLQRKLLGLQSKKVEVDVAQQLETSQRLSMPRQSSSLSRGRGGLGGSDRHSSSSVQRLSFNPGGSRSVLLSPPSLSHKVPNSTQSKHLSARPSMTTGGEGACGSGRLSDRGNQERLSNHLAFDRSNSSKRLGSSDFHQNSRGFDQAHHLQQPKVKKGPKLQPLRKNGQGLGETLTRIESGRPSERTEEGRRLSARHGQSSITLISPSPGGYVPQVGQIQYIKNSQGAQTQGHLAPNAVQRHLNHQPVSRVQQKQQQPLQKAQQAQTQIKSQQPDQGIHQSAGGLKSKADYGQAKTPVSHHKKSYAQKQRYLNNEQHLHSSQAWINRPSITSHQGYNSTATKSKPQKLQTKQKKKRQVGNGSLREEGEQPVPADYSIIKSPEMKKPTMNTIASSPNINRTPGSKYKTAGKQQPRQEIEDAEQRSQNRLIKGGQVIQYEPSSEGSSFKTEDAKRWIPAQLINSRASVAQAPNQMGEQTLMSPTQSTPHLPLYHQNNSSTINYMFSPPTGNDYQSLSVTPQSGLTATGRVLVNPNGQKDMLGKRNISPQDGRHPQTSAGRRPRAARQTSSNKEGVDRVVEVWPSHIQEDRLSGGQLNVITAVAPQQQSRFGLKRNSSMVVTPVVEPQLFYQRVNDGSSSKGQHKKGKSLSPHSPLRGNSEVVRGPGFIGKNHQNFLIAPNSSSMPDLSQIISRDPSSSQHNMLFQDFYQPANPNQNLFLRDRFPEPLEEELGVEDDEVISASSSYYTSKIPLATPNTDLTYIPQPLIISYPRHEDYKVNAYDPQKSAVRTLNMPVSGHASGTKLQSPRGQKTPSIIGDVSPKIPSSSLQKPSSTTLKPSQHPSANSMLMMMQQLNSPGAAQQRLGDEGTMIFNDIMMLPGGNGGAGMPGEGTTPLQSINFSQLILSPGGPGHDTTLNHHGNPLQDTLPSAIPLGTLVIGERQTIREPVEDDDVINDHYRLHGNTPGTIINAARSKKNSQTRKSREQRKQRSNHQLLNLIRENEQEQEQALSDFKFTDLTADGRVTLQDKRPTGQFGTLEYRHEEEEDEEEIKEGSHSKSNKKAVEKQKKGTSYNGSSITEEKRIQRMMPYVTGVDFKAFLTSEEKKSGSSSSLKKKQRNSSIEDDKITGSQEKKKRRLRSDRQSIAENCTPQSYNERQVQASLSPERDQDQTLQNFINHLSITPTELKRHQPQLKHAPTEEVIEVFECHNFDYQNQSQPQIIPTHKHANTTNSNLNQPKLRQSSHIGGSSSSCISIQSQQTFNKHKALQEVGGSGRNLLSSNAKNQAFKQSFGNIQQSAEYCQSGSNKNDVVPGTIQSNYQGKSSIDENLGSLSKSPQQVMMLSSQNSSELHQLDRQFSSGYAVCPSAEIDSRRIHRTQFVPNEPSSKSDQDSAHLPLRKSSLVISDDQRNSHHPAHNYSRTTSRERQMSPMSHQSSLNSNADQVQSANPITSRGGQIREFGREGCPEYLQRLENRSPVMTNKMNLVERGTSEQEVLHYDYIAPIIIRQDRQMVQAEQEMQKLAQSQQKMSARSKVMKHQDKQLHYQDPTPPIRRMSQYERPQFSKLKSLQVQLRESLNEDESRQNLYFRPVDYRLLNQVRQEAARVIQRTYRMHRQPHQQYRRFETSGCCDAGTLTEVNMQSGCICPCHTGQINQEKFKKFFKASVYSYMMLNCVMTDAKKSGATQQSS